MEPVVVLRGEPEDDERAAHVAFSLVLVCIPEKSRNSKIAALDPQSCRLTGRLESHEPAICPAHETVRVIRRLDRSRVGFQFSAED